MRSPRIRHLTYFTRDVAGRLMERSAALLEEARRMLRRLKDKEYAKSTD